MIYQIYDILIFSNNPQTTKKIPDINLNLIFLIIHKLRRKYFRYRSRSHIPPQFSSLSSLATWSPATPSSLSLIKFGKQATNRPVNALGKNKCKIQVWE